MSKEIAFLKSASESRHRALMEMLVNLKNDQDLKHKAVMEMLGELRPKSCGINDDIDPVDVGFVGADVGDTSGGGGVSKENDKIFENESFTQVFDECIQAMQEDAAGDMVIADDKNDTVNENEKTTGNDVEETMNIVKPHDDVADVVKDLEEEAHIFNNMNVEIFDKVVDAAVGDLAKKKVTKQGRYCIFFSLFAICSNSCIIEFFILFLFLGSYYGNTHCWFFDESSSCVYSCCWQKESKACYSFAISFC
ncbi:uncharacterized protein LOC133800438 [Humulus lupulus]|uniref:uncharacterized protein LOC133800438 n=1 Tax=Humulus lupulus TaxID=3486 RepID=UPI002B409A6E|nr:uncharacterized protein LOC133800438 [Humulus lupulus]